MNPFRQLGLRWKHEMPLADRVLLTVASLASLIVALGIMVFLGTVIWALFL